MDTSVEISVESVVSVHNREDYRVLLWTLSCVHVLSELAHDSYRYSLDTLSFYDGRPEMLFLP